MWIWSNKILISQHKSYCSGTNDWLHHPKCNQNMATFHIVELKSWLQSNLTDISMKFVTATHLKFKDFLYFLWNKFYLNRLIYYFPAGDLVLEFSSLWGYCKELEKISVYRCVHIDCLPLCIICTFDSDIYFPHSVYLPQRAEASIHYLKDENFD